MKNKTGSHPLFLVLIVTALIATSCNLPGGQAQPTEQQVDVVYTQAAQTLVAQLTQNAPPPTEPAPEQLPTDTPTPTEAPPAESPTPQASDTPAATFTLSVPVISATVNTNCRRGPSVLYDPPVGVLAVGQVSNVIGQDSGRNWWYIENPGKPGEFCWVWRETTQVSGETNNLPIITPPPPPPTATFTPTPGAAFSASFDNVHNCGGTPTAIFEILNSGGADLESLRLTIENLTDSTVLFGPNSSDAPFMGAETECPPGGDTLPTGVTYYVGGAIGAGNSGDDARATIRLCTEDDLDGSCEEVRVNFDIP